jgi:tRNA/tmRNA/rRNA uracil-C5-methylase (TrmA/RlmC/RlmD family)
MKRKAMWTVSAYVGASKRFVENTSPDDCVLIKITEVRDDFAFAE